MTPLVYVLPVLAGLLLISILRRDQRRQIIENRLITIKHGTDEPPAPPISLQRLRLAASQGMSVAALLPGQLRVWLDRAFEATGNSIGIMHLLFAGLIAAVVVNLFVTWVLNLDPSLTLLITFAAAATMPVVVLRMAQSGYQNRFLDVFPDALDLVGRGVKAGLPVNEAMVVAGQESRDPVGKELRRTLEQVQLGVQMIDALEATANRVRVADFRFMVVALALQARTGGSLAETLGNLSRVIRARKGLRIKVRGLTAEAKVSAAVLAALPFVVGALMFAMNRQLVLPLVTDPRGRFMVGVAFVSLISGLTVMYVLIKRAVR